MLDRHSRYTGHTGIPSPMPSVLFTYSLNPLVGLKLLVKSAQAISPEVPQPIAWGRVLQGALPALQHWIRQPMAPMQVSVGSLVPEDAQHLSRWQILSRLKFFVAVETEADLSRPALPSGQSSAIQVYRHHQGSESYRTQVVRFRVGSPRRRARRR